ncbi:cysteine hydrolase family protein [Roseibium sp.]|uniref:cysteine hydrolase family protein n=1 Tax=Roseibium sp. TaxID=1936156 RepID=UPI003B5015CC
MSFLTLAVSGLGALVLWAAGYFFWVVWISSKATMGKPIDRAARPNTALLVIDVQEDFTRNSPKPYSENARTRGIDRINREIEAAHAAGHEVILVKQVFRHWPAILAMKLLMGGIGTPGRKGLAFDEDLKTGSAPVFEKPIGDAFSNPELDAYLADRKVGHLRLTGLDACQCVQFTAKGALNRGYSVEIIEPATMTVTPEKWGTFKKELEALGAQVIRDAEQAA